MPSALRTVAVAVAGPLLASALTLGACAQRPDRTDAVATSSVALPGLAATGAETAPPLDVAQIDSLIRRTVASKKLIGLSVGIAQGGKVVLARGYGLRALGGHDSVTTTTMFAIGSVTKQFTCSAILDLAQDGKLSLSDPVSKYFANLTRAKDITLLDLGQHVSGYRDYYPLDFVDREMQHDQTADSIIDEYATRPLDFEPGTRWSYSNTNFLILGRVVEKVSGQPYGAFVKERFFTPLGMQHTQFEPAPGGPDMASGYTTFALGPAIPARPEGRGWASTAGAIWSTPSDLLAWDMGLIGGKVINNSSYLTLTTPRRLRDGRSTGYGCGEGVREEGPAIILSHGGAVSGFVASNIVVPSTGSAVVTLANTDFATLDSLDEAVVAQLVPHVDVPAINGPPAVAAARTFLTALQQGRVDRSTLGDDYNAFLTPALVAGAHASLRPISAVEVQGASERGGMEVADIRFKTGPEAARALMYRTPDGKIQEFLFQRE